MSFDAKDFDRPKLVEEQDPKNPEISITKNKGFYTPLGAGVLFKNADLFNKAYLENIQELSQKFEVPINFQI